MKTILNYPLREYNPGGDDISWIFTGEFCLLDNFALTPVTVDVGFGEREYFTSEHAFAGAKTLNLVVHNYVIKDPRPGISKSRGREVNIRKDWSNIRFSIMWKVLEAKFSQHPEVLELLLSTDKREIMEGNTWYDQVWGITPQGRGLWTGRNALGEMLMEIRRDAK